MLAALILTIMPSFLFSGFLFPIFTMPKTMQLYTYLFPARFYIEITRGVLLKGVGLRELWVNAALLSGYAAVVWGLPPRGSGGRWGEVKERC